MKLFKKNDQTVKFKCSIGGYYISQPVQKASKVSADWMQIQKKESKTETLSFPKCPGMFDLFSAGYIIPAWEDININCDKEGKFIVSVGAIMDKPKEGQLPPQPQIEQKLQASPMNYSIVKGILKPETQEEHVIKIPSPWQVFTKKGYSCYVLPAVYHSPFLQDIYVWGGIVDYDDFHTINFIFTPMKEINVTIYAGTPLLQVIPFKREPITAIVGETTKNEKYKSDYSFRSGVTHLYRKAFQKEKRYDIQYENVD